MKGGGRKDGRGRGGRGREGADLSSHPPSYLQEVFDQEHASNQALTWGLRGLGWLLTIVGFNLVAGILTTLGELVGWEGSNIAQLYWMITALLEHSSEQRSKS